MDSTVFKLYKEFASHEETQIFSSKFINGISWGEAKEELYTVVQRELSPMREKYEYYIANPQIVDDILQKGAEKARIIANNRIKKVRKTIGI